MADDASTSGPLDPLDAGDPTARFAACLRDEPLHLDRPALLIAAHAHVELDLATELRRLDALAAAAAEDVDASDPSALCAWLFAPSRFVGNTVDYYDPENSFLDAVLDRRLGIPISLSVLAIEVGRRTGADLVGVGMPGHFLLRDARSPDSFFDTFDGGAQLRAADAERLFRRLHGSVQSFDAAMLEPAPPIEIVRRVLANLMAVYLENSTLHHLAWVLRLRTLLPGTPVRERVRLASTLGRLGRYGQAAAEYDLLATLDEARAQEHRNAAIRMRAASN